MTSDPSRAAASPATAAPAPEGSDATSSGPRRVTPRAGEPFSIRVDGADVPAFPGETLAAALLTAGVTAFRTDAAGRPRAPFCHMGTCFECVVDVAGERVRACLVPATPDLEVRSTDDR